MALVLAFCSFQRPAPAQVTVGPIQQTFTTSGSPPIKACGLRGENSATFQSTGAGPTDAYISNDGFSWTPAIISNASGAVQAQPFTPTSGTTYQVTPLTGDCVEIAPDSTWSGQTATITFKASNAIATVPTPGSGGGGGATPIPTPAGGVYPVTCASPGQNPCAVTTSPPYVAPTCPAAPSAPCVQLTGPPAPQPSPLYTTPVSCVTPSCNVTAYQGTSPWVQSTPSSAPLPTASAGAAAPGNAVQVLAYLSCIFPAGATPAPSAGNAIVAQCNNNGALQVNEVNPNNTIYSVSGALTSGTTLQLVAPVAGQSIYIYFAGLQGTAGGQTSATINLEWGTGATCGGSTVTLLPIAPVFSATSTNITYLWGGGGGGFAGQALGPVPAAIPIVTPAGDGVCIVPGGTTVNAKAIILYAQH